MTSQPHIASETLPQIPRNILYPLASPGTHPVMFAVIGPSCPCEARIISRSIPHRRALTRRSLAIEITPSNEQDHLLRVRAR